MKWWGKGNSWGRGSLNSQLWKDQNGLCFYCEKPMQRSYGMHYNHPTAASREHLERLADGGEDDASNIRLACRECNSNRGETPWPQWKTIRMLGEPVSE